MSEKITVPPLKLVRNRLEMLNQVAMKQLAKDSGVPFQTISNIRYGITKNPGIETVRMFFPLLPEPSQAKQPQE